MDPSAPTDSKDRPADPAVNTALWCLATVATHHGLNVPPSKLFHEFGAVGHNIDGRRLVAIARAIGLRGRAVRYRWDQLKRLGGAFPVIARLGEKHHVVLAGIREENGEESAVVLDPLAEKPGLAFVPRAAFEARWTGQIALIRKSREMEVDQDRPFGLRWFIPEITRHRRLFAEVALAALMLHGLALALPIFFQIVIDKVLANYAVATFQALLIGVAIAIVFDAGFTFMRRYLLLYATNKLDIRVAMRTFDHLLRLPIDFFERRPAGVLAKHMQQGQRIREFLTGKMFLTFLDATVLFVFVPVLFFYSPQLALIVLAFAAITCTVAASLMPAFRERLRQLYLAEGERQALLVETIHGMRTVKSLTLEPTQRRNWEERSAAAVASNFRVGRISTIAQAVVGMLEKSMIVAVIGFGVMLVFDNTMSIGALVAFQMLAGRVSAPLVQMVGLIHEYQEVAISVRMLGQVMNSPVENLGRTQGLRVPINGALEFRGVTFRYDNRDVPALSNVSFAAPAGTIVGIVGRSGSGKTTITRLLQGLYAAEQGSVLVDGHDVRAFDLYYLRRAIGVVLQENFLFRGSVSQNLGIADPQAPFAQIVEAARLAGADEFIQRLPQGYDTPLEEGGANLSGGQRQRIAIARALLKRPRILILDEATSALDPESEEAVRRNLRAVADGRTVVIVSHRLSMLRDADSIVMLDNGRVIAAGTHDELVHACLPYRQLWQQQTG